MNPSRIKSIVLSTLTVWFGLHLLRAFLPNTIWYLSQFLGPEQLALFALGVFSLTLLAAVLRPIFGERGALLLAIGGVGITRLAAQFALSAQTLLWLSATGLVFFAIFLPIWLQSSRNRPTPQDMPILAAAFPVAFLIDTASRTWLLTYDLIWRRDPLAQGTMIGLFLLLGVLAWLEIGQDTAQHPTNEPSLGNVWPLIGIGPFLYLAMGVVHNPSALAAAGQWNWAAANLAVNFLAGLGALSCLFAAAWPRRRRWLAGLASAVVLTLSMALIAAQIQPAGLWFGLSAVSLWAGLGWILAGSTRVSEQHRGLWRTSLGLFLALVVLLLVVFVITQFNIPLAIAAAGAVLGLGAIKGASSAKSRALQPLGADMMLIAISAAITLLSSVIWALTQIPDIRTQTPPAGQPLRVMTYNIHQGIDADLRMNMTAIADTIASLDADIIILNEVNRGRANNGFVDVLPMIQSRLKMPFVFGANFEDGQYGNALFSRYPILAWSNTHYQHNTTETRGLLHAVVQTAGEPINVYGTHLDHLSGPRNARAEQVMEALAIWDKQPRSLLLGDLNATPDSSELQPIYKAGFIDALAQAGMEDAFTFWDPNPNRRIDYIFYTPDLELKDGWVVESRASDHLPVLAEIQP